MNVIFIMETLSSLRWFNQNTLNCQHQYMDLRYYTRNASWTVFGSFN